LRAAYREFKSLTAAERYARRELKAAQNRHPENYVEAVITGLYYELWDWHPAYNGHLSNGNEIEWIDADSNTLIERPQP
jgi:hypothetical protein